MIHLSSIGKAWRVGIGLLAISLLAGCGQLSTLHPAQTPTGNRSPVSVKPVALKNAPTPSKGNQQSQHTHLPTVTINGASKTQHQTRKSSMHQKSVDLSNVSLVKQGDQNAESKKLNECLSLLGYLPVTFTPAHGLTAQEAVTDLAKTSVSTPLSGTYQFRHKATQQQLGKLWSPASDSVITKGAVMQFELHHKLIVDGVAGPHVWQTIYSSLRAHKISKRPYVFVTVSEASKESLRVWQGGKVVLSTPANTGIAQSPTALGTWPVYLRYRSQDMKGTTPWGTKYNDPGVPNVSYFNGGDAIHGFPRASYGYPQSLGCVEVPIPISKKIYSLINYGTLVSVRK